MGVWAANEASTPAVEFFSFDINFFATETSMLRNGPLSGIGAHANRTWTAPLIP